MWPKKIAIIVINLVTPNAAAKREHFFKKPASDNGLILAEHWLDIYGKKQPSQAFTDVYNEKCLLIKREGEIRDESFSLWIYRVMPHTFIIFEKAIKPNLVDHLSVPYKSYLPHYVQLLD